MRKLFLAIVLWLALAGIVWLTGHRGVPGSAGDWLLLIAVGPLAYLAASAIGEIAFNLYARLPGVRHIHAFAERRADGREFSWLRVAIYLGTILGFLCVLAGVAWLVRTP